MADPAERLRRVGPLAGTDEDVLAYIIAAIASLGNDDEDEDPVSLVEATVGCKLSDADKEAIRSLADELSRAAALTREHEREAFAAAPIPRLAPVFAEAGEDGPIATEQRAATAEAARAPVVLQASSVLVARADSSTICFLREMRPDVPDSVIEYVLMTRCRGDQEEAVECLLQMEREEIELLTAKLARESARAHEQEEAQRRQEREKKRLLVGRYGHVPVEAPPIDSGARGKPGAAARAPMEVRFRDNQIAQVAKGQKFIIEQKVAEWDGGSRGTVKTKGKRGKGFV